MNQGDIVLVPFPYTDLSAIKNRPAIIISKNNNSEDVILLAITSRNIELGFEINNNDLKEGSLPAASFVKIDKVVSLRKSIIRKKVAILKNDVCEKIIKKFKHLF